MSLDNQTNIKKTPHYVGHRQRLKDKFLRAKSDGFADYELLELLLFYSLPRKDVKPLSKDILNNFKGINNLLKADREQLLSIDGTNDSLHLHLKVINELMRRSLFDRVKKKHIISSWSALQEYLQFTMGSLRIEQFRVLFLNKKNILIADEVMAMGTIDQTPVYPREIVKKSLFHEAGALILVHNHPSGNPKPSNSDIDLTAQIVNACKTVNVKIHDHVIIAENDYFSFKSNMLL